MTEGVIRTSDFQKGGLFLRVVYGLNTLTVNGVVSDPWRQPETMFVRWLADLHRGCCHLGSLALMDLGDDLEEITGLSAPAGTIRTSISIHNGTFYRLTPDELPAYILRCEDGLPEVLTAEVLEYSIRCDSLALYLGGGLASFERMRAISDGPFDGDWIQLTLDYFSLVLTSAADGGFFQAYARDKSALSVLTGPLETATDLIVHSEWYQSHASELIWDELELCLRLPSRDAAAHP